MAFSLRHRDERKVRQGERLFKASATRSRLRRLSALSRRSPWR
jgi:hypothetical protein